jgi:hypothetical protein
MVVAEVLDRPREPADDVGISADLELREDRTEQHSG